MPGDRRSRLRDRTATALTRLDPQWQLLPDLPWPGRPDRGGQHVVVGPTGVYLVAEHPWRGRVTVRNDLLRVDGRSRDLYVRDVLGAASSLRDLLPEEYRSWVRPVLWLTDQPPLLLRHRGVLVCGATGLAETLGRGDAVLGADHRDYLESVVRAAMRLSADGVVVQVRGRPRHPHASIPSQRARPARPRNERPVPAAVVRPERPLPGPVPAPERASRRRARIARSTFAVVMVGALVVLDLLTEATTLIGDLGP